MSKKVKYEVVVGHGCGCGSDEDFHYEDIATREEAESIANSHKHEGHRCHRCPGKWFRYRNIRIYKWTRKKV